MNFKSLLLIIKITCICKAVYAQAFTIKFDTADNNYKSAPAVYMYINALQEYQSVQTTVKRSPGYFEGSVSVTKPFFIQLVNTQLLAIPNQSLTGTLKGNGDKFLTKDSNNINSLLIEFDNRYYGITARYAKRTSYKRFLELYDSIRNYTRSVLSALTSGPAKERYRINNEVISAFREYMMMRLAHFSIYPVLLKEEYNNSLFPIIKKDINVNNPPFWLQVQWGKIFLKNYFLKVVLPQKNYNAQKAFASEKIFTNADIKKYLEYQYFYYMLNSDSSINRLPDLKKEYYVYRHKYFFTPEEEKDVNKLKAFFSVTGKNIIPLFSQQLLIDYKGKVLGAEKETILKNKGRVILYYWASWCTPCLETIKKIKSEKIISEGSTYNLIFISIDEKQTDWVNKRFTVFNANNSFRLADLKSPSFYKALEIQAIPRLFLTDNGYLLNENFLRERFQKIIQ